MKVLHVITSLGAGGAEMMLYRLLQSQPERAHNRHVVSLTTIGSVGEKIRALGIGTEALGLSGPGSSLAGMWRLRRIILREQPDIVQTWMYHSDFLGGLVAKSTGHPVVWGLHNYTLGPFHATRPTRLVRRACALMSAYVPDAIVSCSEAGQQLHVEMGYDAAKFRVIPNGFDLDLFAPDQQARAALREELGVSPTTPLVGIAARFDPIKDHPTFLAAAGTFHAQRPDVHFVMAGWGIESGNRELQSSIQEYDLSCTTHLLGPRDDMPRLLAALDVATLTSYGEAFPLVLGEAMACGVPCVATDVGDAARIVGDTGMIVPPRSPQAIAEAWSDLLDCSVEERARLGRAARTRIARNYALPQVAEMYTALHKEVFARTASRHHHGPPRRELALSPSPAPAMPVSSGSSRVTTWRQASEEALPSVTLPDVGALVVSLDFELLWGHHDLLPADGGAYRDHLLGARTVIPRMLELFDEFGVRATWATVGMLFAHSREELERYIPSVKPDYENASLLAYQYRVGRDEEEDPLHFAPSLIKKIREFDGQEIATHTFAHYYCLERGHTPAAFRADIDSAVAIARANGVEIKSIVFPRNQYAPSLNSLLLEAGITCCRGSRRYWTVRSAPTSQYLHPVRRAGRLIDTYMPVQRHNSSGWDEIWQPSGMCNVPGNRFMVPRHPQFQWRSVQRMAGEIRAAAAAGRIYHVWWHPANYGVDQESGLAFLRAVLEVAAECRDRNGMRFLSMSDIAYLVNPAEVPSQRRGELPELRSACPSLPSRLARVTPSTT